MSTYAILLTCHNRRESTIACLSRLEKQIAKELPYKIDIFLVDDGSADGTYQLVRECYPCVNLIKGSGDLFWNGGMRLAWLTALQKLDYDGVIWLNDDVELYDHALATILNTYTSLSKHHKVGAICGSTYDEAMSKISYGGRRILSQFDKLKLSSLIYPEDTPVRCDVFNGNFVFIPRDAFLDIGVLSEKYTHSMGDHDYSYSLLRKGYSNWLMPNYCGNCSANHINSKLYDKSIGIDQKMILLNNPVQISPTNEWIYFVRKNAGLSWPKYYFKALIRKFFPKLYIKVFYEFLSRKS